jgi:hypothetical protein
VLAERAEGFRHGKVGVEDGKDMAGADVTVTRQLVDPANSNAERRCGIGHKAPVRPAMAAIMQRAGEGRQSTAYAEPRCE